MVNKSQKVLKSIKIDVTGCNDCPYFKKQDTGRESWLSCVHPKYDPVYGHVIEKVNPNWCPLRG